MNVFGWDFAKFLEKEEKTTPYVEQARTMVEPVKEVGDNFALSLPLPGSKEKKDPTATSRAIAETLERGVMTRSPVLYDMPKFPPPTPTQQQPSAQERVLLSRTPPATVMTETGIEVDAFCPHSSTPVTSHRTPSPSSNAGGAASTVMSGYRVTSANWNTPASASIIENYRSPSQLTSTGTMASTLSAKTTTTTNKSSTPRSIPNDASSTTTGRDIYAAPRGSAINKNNNSSGGSTTSSLAGARGKSRSPFILRSSDSKEAKPAKALDRLSGTFTYMKSATAKGSLELLKTTDTRSDEPNVPSSTRAVSAGALAVTTTALRSPQHSVSSNTAAFSSHVEMRTPVHERMAAAQQRVGVSYSPVNSNNRGGGLEEPAWTRIIPQNKPYDFKRVDSDDTVSVSVKPPPFMKRRQKKVAGDEKSVFTTHRLFTENSGPRRGDVDYYDPKAPQSRPSAFERFRVSPAPTIVRTIKDAYSNTAVE